MRWRTSALIVPSERVEAAFRKAFLAQLVSAMPGIVDAEAFRPGRDPALRRQMGAEESDVLVGAVGRFAPERRLDEFLTAFPEIKQPPGMKLVGVVLGRGPQRPELERMAADFAPDGRLRVVETTERFPSQLAQLDIGIQMAPGSDGTCRTALEMMACGLAVVVGSGGALGEVVEHGRTGLVVDMKESARLAEAVSALASDAARRQSLGAAARAVATERNAPSSVAARYADIYRRVLGGGA
jgi:phosphatidylinositol alpha 1,6-mannosyltransferase